MKFTTPTPRVSKGQLRCYNCRRALQMKEGDWRERGNQQVFLCKTCDKALRESQHKLD